MSHSWYLPKDYANDLAQKGAIIELAAVLETLLEHPTYFDKNGPKSGRRLVKKTLQASLHLCKMSEDVNRVCNY